MKVDQSDEPVRAGGSAMGLMEDVSRRDSLLETLERTLEESRRLRGQILDATGKATLGENARDLRRTAAPALTWPLPL
jgi:hypothetical protein